jgi:hypothetical protein
MVRIDNYRPFDTVAVVYLAGGAGAPPELVISQGPVAAVVSVRSFRIAVAKDAVDLGDSDAG